MPQRKVLRTVVLHRESGRVVPTLGEIFEFTQEEMETINKIDPEALGRPLIESDLESPSLPPDDNSAAKITDDKVAGAKSKGKATSPAEDDDI